MRFTIDIECNNSAFDPDPWPELARILRDMAGQLEERHPDYMTLRDVNGNAVGNAAFTDSD